MQSLFTRATERSQAIEDDVQCLLDDAAERSTKAISSALASVLNRLPGVRMAYMPLPDQPERRDDASITPAATQE